MATTVHERRSLIGESAKVLGGAAILAFSIYFLVISAHFFTLTHEALGKYFDVKWVLLTHVTGGAFALITGPFLLWDRVRDWSVRVHRRIGQTYLVLVLLSGGCAVYLSLTTAYAVNGPYAFSLQVWVGVWLTSSLIAYRAARRRKVKLHKEWMTRSYLVLLAFVFGALLLQAPPIQKLGTFAELSPSIFWLSWAVPLYLYDLRLATAARAPAG